MRTWWFLFQYWFSVQTSARRKHFWLTHGKVESQVAIEGGVKIWSAHFPLSVSEKDERWAWFNLPTLISIHRTSNVPSTGVKFEHTAITFKRTIIEYSISSFGVEVYICACTLYPKIQQLSWSLYTIFRPGFLNISPHKEVFMNLILMRISEKPIHKHT